jgi:hypothetical protein
LENGFLNIHLVLITEYPSDMLFVFHLVGGYLGDAQQLAKMLAQGLHPYFGEELV